MDTTHITVLNRIDQRTWRTLAEAANLLDISRVSVFCAVRDGRLAGGYIGPQPQNSGTVWNEYVLRGISASRKSRSVVRNLTAFRCQRCGHDLVLDSLGAVALLWDLDAEDFTATGARA